MDISAVAPILSQAGSVLNRFAVIRQLGIIEEPLQRLFLVECECNVSLLACLRLDDESAGQTGQGFWKIASLLETGVLEAVLGSGDESAKVFKSLKSMPILPADAGDEADKDVDSKDNDRIFVAEKLRRLYVNSFAVRAAAQVHLDLSDPVASGMRNMMFRTRLKNLNKAYVEVARALRESLGSDAA